jgi:hypothetical protein
MQSTTSDTISIDNFQRHKTSLPDYKQAGHIQRRTFHNMSIPLSYNRLAVPTSAEQSLHNTDVRSATCVHLSSII